MGWRTATAYDATEAIVEGLSKNPTRTELYNALSARNFSAEGATGLRSGARSNKERSCQYPLVMLPF